MPSYAPEVPSIPRTPVPDTVDPEPVDRVPAAAPSTAPAAPEAAAATVTPARARQRRRRWIAAIAAIVVIAGIGVYWRVRTAAPAAQFVTAPVTRGNITRGITASGSVNPVVTVQVGAFVSGVIQELHCDFNTQVTKGEVCAKIDPRPYETVIEQDKANLATAKSQLAKDQTSLGYAKVSYDRTVKLAAQGIASQDQVDSAKSTNDQAVSQIGVDQSMIDQRQAELDSAQVNLGYTNIISPVNGTVVSRNVQVGQTVASSFQTPTLFVIANDLTKMQVDANVSESDIGGIQNGDKATFTVDAFPARTFPAVVTQVRQSPQTVQNVVTYDVVISVDNPDLALKPGMTAAVHVITDERDNVLRVPDRALHFNPNEQSASANRSAGGEAGAGGRAANGAGGRGANGNGGAGRGGGRGAGGGASRGANAAQAQTPASTPSEVQAQPGTVWVMRTSGLERVPVTVGLDDDTNAEITSGELQPGDQVVVTEEARSASGTAPASGRSGGAGNGGLRMFGR
jgi:HlyD family secretion protein